MSTEAADVSLPVQRQLEAYNCRDIEAFMSWWVQDCRYYAFPDQLVAEGADAIRVRHIERFREPNLHGRLVGRFVVGNLVVDQEVVTRTFPEGPGEIDVLAIYEIEDGRITRAWFKMGTPRLLAIPSERLVVTVAVEHPVQEEVASLLRRSDAVAAQLYPGEYRRPISPDTLAVPGTHVLLARREGLAIGLCVLFERGDSTVELKRMIVDEQARGQGVGAALRANDSETLSPREFSLEGAEG